MLNKKSQNSNRTLLKNESDKIILLALGFFSILVVLKTLSISYGFNQADKYDLFVDLLFILIGVSGIIGISIYKLISEKIENQVNQVIKNSHKYTEKEVKRASIFVKNIMSNINTGLLYYNLSQSRPYIQQYFVKNESEIIKDNIEKLNEAIDVTKKALNSIEELSRELERESKIVECKKCEKYLCECKNNLAGFLSIKYFIMKKNKPEKVIEEDIKEAEKYALYIFQKKEQHPENKKKFEKTYYFVKEIIQKSKTLNNIE